MAAIVDLFEKRGLVVGIANDSSIAAGCAAAFRAAGGDLAVIYLNDKAAPFVRPVADALGASLFMPCDVRIAGQLEAVFDTIANEWGGLDFLLHSIAFAPREDLQTSIVNCSAEGFAGHGYIVPFLHPDGAARRPADEGRRIPDNRQLFRS